MKVLTRLNFVNFKQNRVRTAVTITGVALSVMLILIVIGVATSIWYSIIEDARRNYGDYHVMFEGIPGDKVTMLENSHYYNVMYYSEPVEEFIDEDGVKHLYWSGPLPAYSYRKMSGSELIRDENHKYNVFVKYKNLADDTERSLKMQERELFDAGVEFDGFCVNITVQIFEGDLGDIGRILYASLATLAIGTMAIVSAFIIRNSFNISITERVRQFGMLSSVGARPRQIRRMVYQESLLIGLVAIPLGILLGVLLTWGVVLMVNNLLSDIMEIIGSEMLFFIPWQAIVITLIVGLFIVFLSAASPAIVASRYSPLFALRSNQDIKIKARKVRTSKLTRKIWGMGGVMARKNLKRSRQKYRTTVISIVLSVASFIGVTSFMSYGHKLIDLFISDTGANFVIQGGSSKLFEDVVKKFDLKEYAEYYSIALFHEEEKEYTPKTIPVQVTIVSRDEFARYAKKVGLKNADNSRTAILADTIKSEHAGGNISYHRTTAYEVGEEVNLRTVIYMPREKIIEDVIEDSDIIIDQQPIDADGEQKVKNEKIKISAVTEVLPLGYSPDSLYQAELFISEDYYRMDNIYQENIMNTMMYIADTGKGNSISEFLDKEETREEYCVDEEGRYRWDYYYIDTEKETRVVKSLILLFEIMTYGFIIIVSLIGITNIFNTITTNIALRAREFAILKSVGMTSKEFNRMIRLESIMYSSRALLIGLPIGLLISYGISKLFDSGMFGFGWLIPWNAIIISIASVAILVAAIMRYSVREIKKQNIIETIRKESF